MSPRVSFERPPVVETVLCVQFDRLPGLEHRHLAAYWASLGPDWADLDLLPEIPATFEQFGDHQAWAQAGANIAVGRPRWRLQIRNHQRDRMIQAQNGRFVQNWLGHVADSYPRYTVLRPEFQDHFDRFTAFLGREELGEISVNQWEITYVNHIGRGSVWETPSDWGSLLPSLFGSGAVSPDLSFEGLGRSCAWRFEIPPERGRLHVLAEHARVGPGRDREALVLKLTARGPLAEGRSAYDGLDLGHDRIVSAFYDMTSEEAHEYWGEAK